MKETKKKLAIVVSGICLCCLISFLSIITYDRFYALKIVAIDTTPFIKKIQSEYLKGGMTEAELDKKLKGLLAIIESQPKNQVILMSEVVVSKNVKKYQP
jgi:hypothetical protein